MSTNRPDVRVHSDSTSLVTVLGLYAPDLSVTAVGSIEELEGAGIAVIESKRLVDAVAKAEGLTGNIIAIGDAPVPDDVPTGLRILPRPYVVLDLITMIREMPTARPAPARGAETERPEAEGRPSPPADTRGLFTSSRFPGMGKAPSRPTEEDVASEPGGDGISEPSETPQAHRPGEGDRPAEEVQPGPSPPAPSAAPPTHHPAEPSIEKRGDESQPVVPEGPGEAQADAEPTDDQDRPPDVAPTEDQDEPQDVAPPVEHDVDLHSAAEDAVEESDREPEPVEDAPTPQQVDEEDLAQQIEVPVAEEPTPDARRESGFGSVLRDIDQVMEFIRAMPFLSSQHDFADALAGTIAHEIGASNVALWESNTSGYGVVGSVGLSDVETQLVLHDRHPLVAEARRLDGLLAEEVQDAGPLFVGVPGARGRAFIALPVDMPGVLVAFATAGADHFHPDALATLEEFLEESRDGWAVATRIESLAVALRALR